MNRTGSQSSNRGESKSKATDDRELFITTDFRSIPAAELRPMIGSLSQWLSAVVAHKIKRSSPQIQYAIESRRLVQRDAEHVPKRIMKRLTELRKLLEKLNFDASFYATIPAIGPFSKAIMGMSHIKKGTQS